MGVVATVNDQVITNYDLDQRIGLFSATSGVRPTKDTLPQIRMQVLRALEDEILEVQEATKHKISIGKPEVDRAIANIAEDNKVSTDEILNTVKRAGVREEVLRNQITAQITWQKVVSSRYGTDILITEQQINDAMERLRKGGDKPQFLVSEIYLAVDKPEEEATTRTSVAQMAQQILQGAPFATMASQFSQSPSAAEGGDIGWVIQGQLDEALDSQLVKLLPGQIAGPIKAEGGYYIVLVRERKEPIGTNIEEMMEQMMPQLIFDPARPIPIDRLLIPAPTAAPQAVKDRAMSLAKQVHDQVRSCNDLPAVSQQLQGTVYNRIGLIKPNDLSKEGRDALASTDPGHIANPFFSQAGVELFMRCDPAVQRPVEFALPSRDQLQNQLFVQQMTILAKSYLRDLRRDAVVVEPR